MNKATIFAELSARPQRATTAEEFLLIGLQPLEEAIEHKDWPRFEQVFQHMRGACMACHAKNDHAFIVLPIEPPMGSSPVLATEHE